METNLEKGKKLLIGIIIFILGISLYSTVYYILKVGLEQSPQQIIRLVLTCVLCYFLYKGHVWVKWIMVFLFVVGALVGFVSLLYAITLLSALFFASYTTSAILLIKNQDIKAFMLSQRETKLK